MYECSAENDLRVSKIVYTLEDSRYSSNKLMPIGYSNNYRGNMKHIGDISKKLETTTIGHHNRRKYFKNKHGEYILRRKYFRNRKLKNMRLHNHQKTTPATQNLPGTTNSYNSPYIIILDEYETNKRLQTSTAKVTYAYSGTVSCKLTSLPHFAFILSLLSLMSSSS